MKINRAVLSTILSLFLLSPCIAQSYRVASVHTRLFHHPQQGIISLVRATNSCQREEQSNYNICRSENTGSIVEDIAESLAAFAKSRNLILVDADSNYEDNCIIEGKVADVTREFIDEYNHTHQ